MCGEQHHQMYHIRQLLGSPPRVRGTVAWGICHAKPSRITPACAGNRPTVPIQRMTFRDHPRVCGEQQAHGLLQIRRIGSPPRVRGTAFYENVITRYCRITPACAGNRYRWGRSRIGPGDHPRVCGEQHYRGWQGGFALGSPPRVRGTAAAYADAAQPVGITPACAGNR